MPWRSHFGPKILLRESGVVALARKGGILRSLPAQVRSDCGRSVATSPDSTFWVRPWTRFTSFSATSFPKAMPPRARRIASIVLAVASVALLVAVLIVNLQSPRVTLLLGQGLACSRQARSE